MHDGSPPVGPGAGDSDSWPAQLTEVFERSITAEFATLTRTGAPVTVPTTPYVGETARTLDVSTGLTYPAKAERARRNPRVAVLFADTVGSSRRDTTVVAVQGMARVRDADLQANTDRYVRASMQKLPEATRGVPRFVLRRLAWYFTRIWVEVTPLHIQWWESRALERTLGAWHAPDGTAAPLSDPAPSGPQPRRWLEPPGAWQPMARAAVARLSQHDLTVVDANGFPLCLPVARSRLTDEGFALTLGPAAPDVESGPACLTMHAHPEAFVGQENRTFVGEVVGAGNGEPFLRVERALAHWSIAGPALPRSVRFLMNGRRLAPRLAPEAARRLQPVPAVRLPGRS
ncbi:MAG TPA: pyridoxamine 5'-phosphate oxidase family protein [Acidimicrobiales bacterium]|nr:pyridoxamine 5'-phosphate oxidase family protein [Acidimicrobiales bacterium]